MELEINDLKIENNKITKEIELMKINISNMINENCEFKKFFENDKNWRVINTDIDEQIKFECDSCSFEAKTESGLKTHRGKKHKVLVQLDGNVSMEDLDEHPESNMELKVIFIGEDNVSAEAELREFYIGELESNYSEDIKIIENELRDIYDGDDGCYNNGEFRKYTYTFKLSNKYSWEDIKKAMFTDKVLDLYII